MQARDEEGGRLSHVYEEEGFTIVETVSCKQ